MNRDWDSRDELYWATTTPGQGFTGTENFGDVSGWSGNGTEHSFYLCIPAPASAGLLSLGALAALRRRR